MRHRQMSEASEAELVRLAQERNQEAFAELMHRNAPASLRLALSILKNREEAEDEVQTSFMKAWIHLPGFQSEARFSTWLRTIVQNQSFMSLRKSRRAKWESLDGHDDGERAWELPAAEPGPEAQLGEQELSRHLKAEVRKLPNRLREVVELRDMEQLSTEDAALHLGISQAAIKSRLLRARAMLRERMERYAAVSGRMMA